LWRNLDDRDICPPLAIWIRLLEPEIRYEVIPTRVDVFDLERAVRTTVGTSVRSEWPPVAIFCKHPHTCR
jgi:hypothetical protein